MKDIVVYFTYGLADNKTLLKLLDGLYKIGVKAVELGIPYSDPVADGPIIQQASAAALKNGASLTNAIIFLNKNRADIKIPIYLMGYINSFYSYGMKKLLDTAKGAGIKGAIIPDLPIEEFKEFRESAKIKNFALPCLVTPLTSDIRAERLAKTSTGFIYLVPRMGITGTKTDDFNAAISIADKIRGNAPIYIGFGIHDAASLKSAINIADGAIIGSAFIERYMQNREIKKPLEWLSGIMGQC